MRRLASIGGALLICAIAACSSADSETSQETTVDPNSVAGDYRGITGRVDRIAAMPSDFVLPRDIEIWLPPSYDSSPNRRYPVLYMHDGQNLFDPEQSKYAKWDWGIDEAMTALIETGSVGEAIIVGAHSIETVRNNDLFPENAGIEFPEIFNQDPTGFFPENRNGNNYLRFLTEELKPLIDKTYRTKTNRENTFVMGSSMGGLASLYAITQYPEVFSGAAMVSTHFPPGDGALVKYFSTKLPNPQTHRLYFDYGTETLDHNYEGFQDRMDKAGIEAGFERGENWTTRKFEGHDHSERAWRNRVHIPLQFLLAGKAVEGGEER